MSRRAVVAAVVLALAVGGVAIASSRSGTSGNDGPHVQITPTSPSSPDSEDPGPAIGY